MTEWGSLALVDEQSEGKGSKVSLPGVRKGDHSGRHFKPEVRVAAVQFSPTGQLLNMQRQQICYMIIFFSFCVNLFNIHHADSSLITYFGT